MSKLDRAMQVIDAQLSEKESRQENVLRANREIIRDCAKAIKYLHVGDFKACEELLPQIDVKVAAMKNVDRDFEHISQQAYQEVVEIKVLNAIYKKQPIPDYTDLNVDFKPWLSGLADVVGELRRALQLALRANRKEDAEYYFEKMNELYDNLMVLKYSASLVGALKHKQDMVRSQVEHARSEMLK
ncbi:hypothetical protein KJ765_06255 [Candidatus Micrarchaeota archaeon]|nr:hypothetical protein [Candidatus Micrarchaeota archaeon]